MTTQTLHLIDEYLTQGGYTHGIDAETLEREAHLVAAAPDLLAALKDVAGSLTAFADAETDDGKMWILDILERVIHDAIEKAEGN